MKVLLAVATHLEIQPFLDQRLSDRPWEICITGVGLMAATFSLTRALMKSRYDLVLQAGVAGSFDARLPPGSLAVVEKEFLGDLGAEDHTLFKDLFELGLCAENEFPFQQKALINPFSFLPFKNLPPAVDAITVQTVSGHAPTIAARTGKLKVALESMEGAALHYVCLQLGVPFLQLRAVSNFVEPRNRSNWQLPLAIRNLNEQLFLWQREQGLEVGNREQMTF